MGCVPAPGIATNLSLVSRLSDLCVHWVIRHTKFELWAHNGFAIILLFSTASIDRSIQPCLDEANIEMELSKLLSLLTTLRAGLVVKSRGEGLEGYILDWSAADKLRGEWIGADPSDTGTLCYYWPSKIGCGHCRLEYDGGGGYAPCSYCSFAAS